MKDKVISYVRNMTVFFFHSFDVYELVILPFAIEHSVFRYIGLRYFCYLTFLLIVGCLNSSGNYNMHFQDESLN